jgi:SAM-dependent methyltransferase
VETGRELARLGDAWSRLAEADPLWAIYVDRSARHGGWDVEAFYETGVAEIESTLARAEHLGLRTSGQSALDFGCAAGRLTRPLAAHFEQVTGVDIAPRMLELARDGNPVADRCRFVLNTRPDLSLFGGAEFDLVYSSLVLQHMPPVLARAYLAEFARVLRPGGSLIVQLPTRPRATGRGLLYRCLRTRPLGIVQRRILGYPAPMQMHGIPERDVRALLTRLGLDVRAAEATAYAPDWHERRYFCHRQ